MKKLVMAVLMVCMAWSPALAGARDISSPEAKALLEKNKGIFLLDVRTPQENSQARLPGSVLIPIAEFERRINEVPKNRTILVYCAVGARSKPVAEYLVTKMFITCLTVSSAGSATAFPSSVDAIRGTAAKEDTSCVTDVSFYPLTPATESCRSPSRNHLEKTASQPTAKPAATA